MTIFTKNKKVNNILFTRIKPFKLSKNLHTRFSNKMPVMYINSEKILKIQNGILYVGEDQINLTDCRIGDIIRKLVALGITAKVLKSNKSDSKILCNIPALYLSECSNLKVKSYNLIESPVDLNEITDRNNTIESLSEKFQTVEVFTDNKKIESSIQNNKLFSKIKEPSILVVSTLSTEYILFVDDSDKIFTNTEISKNLLKYTED